MAIEASYRLKETGEVIYYEDSVARSTGEDEYGFLTYIASGECLIEDRSVGDSDPLPKTEKAVEDATDFCNAVLRWAGEHVLSVGPTEPGWTPR